MDEDLMDIPQDEGVNMYSNSSSTSLESLQSTNINGECNNSTDERECGPESKDDTEVVVDDSISCLKFHAKNIVFLSISPSSRWLAAGSEDDTCSLWDLDNLSSLTNPYHNILHRETVNSISFNSSSTIVATGDMSGQIICTTIASKASSPTIDECDQVEWIQWHPSATILFAGSIDGTIWMWLINDGAVIQSKVFLSQSKSPCTSASLLENSKTLMAAYGDGTARMWDLRNVSTIADSNFHSECTALDVHKNLAAIGRIDGITSVVNIQGLKHIAEFGERFEDFSNSVETVKFHDYLPWLAVGTSGGILSVYDLENSKPRHQCSHDGMAIVNCHWINKQEFVYILSACIDGCIRIWDAKTGSPHSLLSGSGDEIYHSALLLKKDELNKIFLFAACSNGILRIFDLNLFN